MTFQGQDDPEWWKQCQKWILRTRISNISGTTRAYTPKNKKVEFPTWPTAAILDFAIRGNISACPKIYIF